VQWNVRGSISKCTADPTFISIAHDADILIFCETWLHDDNKYNIVMDGFNAFHCVRHKSLHGGVSVFTKTSLKAKLLKQSTHPDIIWLSILDSILVGACYFSPLYSGQSTSTPYEVLDSQLLQLNKFEHIMLLGDFNSRIATNVEQFSSFYCTRDDRSLLQPRENMDKITNAFGKQCIQFCSHNHLCILNGRIVGDTMGAFTYTSSSGEGNSVVDLGIVSMSMLHRVHQFKVWPLTPVSDHCPISVHFDIVPRSTCNKGKANRKCSWEQKNWTDYAGVASLPQTISALDSCVHDLNSGFISVDESSNKICHILAKCAKRAFRKDRKTKKFTPPPWWDEECRISRCKLDVAFKLGRGTRQYKVLRNEYRTLIKDKIRNHDLLQNKVLLEDMKHNPQNFWSKFNPQYLENPITDLHNWCEHFRSILNRDDLSGESIFKATDYLGSIDTENQSFNDAFSIHEIVACIHNLANNKATSDGFISELFKYARLQLDESTYINVAAKYLCEMFNFIYLNDMPIPESWSESYICPIYKGKGDESDMNNYRGLTVVSAIYKIYTTVLYKRLEMHLESKQLRAHTQCGFRKKHSTATAQFLLAHAIAKTCTHKGAGGHNKPLYVCFIDFQKAFDYVLRNKLFDRLSNIGIKGHLLTTIVHIYSNTVIKVKVNGVVSEEIVTTQNGVKQGCPLSPLLFGVFIDILHEHIRKTCPHMGVQLENLYRICDIFYADDVTLVAQSHEELQSLLEALSIFCHETSMLVNVPKTKVIAFNPWRSHFDSDEPFYYNKLVVDKVQNFSYLGVLFHTNTWLRDSSEALFLKARGAMGGLLKKTKQKHIENFNILSRLFDSLVNSISMFNCQVWGVKYLSCDSIDKVLNNPPQILQLHFLRTISGCHAKVCRMSLLKDFKLEPLQVKIAIACSRFWNNAWKSHSITKEALLGDVSLFCKGHKKNWTALFLESMYNIGLLKYEDWIQIRSKDPHSFHLLSFDENLIRTKYMERYDFLWPTSTQGWVSNYSRSGSCFLRHHNWFYDSDATQHVHFQNNLTQHYMKCLIQFRLGSNCLNNNNHTTSTNNKFCPFCSHVLEDEEHFIFHCPVYSDIRSSVSFIHLWNRNHDMKSFFNQDDQASLARALLGMYKLRRINIQQPVNNI